MTSDDLLERLIDHAVVAGRIVNELPDDRLGRHVAGQLVRCGTSAAPNYAEGCAAESKNDFIHKLSIALKEMRETRTWLYFIIKADLLSAERVHLAHKEAHELCRILGASIGTAKGRREKRNDQEGLQ